MHFTEESWIKYPQNNQELHNKQVVLMDWLEILKKNFEHLAPSHFASLCKKIRKSDKCNSKKWNKPVSRRFSAVPAIFKEFRVEKINSLEIKRCKFWASSWNTFFCKEIIIWNEKCHGNTKKRRFPAYFRFYRTLK